MQFKNSESVEHLLQTLSNCKSLNIKVEIIRCIRRFSVSKKLCQVLAEGIHRFNKENTLLQLLSLIKEDLEIDIVFFLYMEIVWNILDAESGIQAAVYLGTAEPLETIKKIYGSVIISSRQVEKQKRNEMILLLCRIGDYHTSAIELFHQLGIHNLVFAEATKEEFTYEEVKGSNRQVDAEDFEYKRLVINMIKLICKNNEGRKQLMKVISI